MTGHRCVVCGRCTVTCELCIYSVWWWVVDLNCVCIYSVWVGGWPYSVQYPAVCADLTFPLKMTTVRVENFEGGKFCAIPDFALFRKFCGY